MTKYACEKCKDTGWAEVKEDGKEFVRRCDCKSTDRLINLCEKSNIPKRFAGHTLEHYYPERSNPSQEKAKKIVQKFIEDYPAVLKGILLQGSIGLGKTQLLCSIATELMKKDENIDVYYIDWNDLVRQMRTGEGAETRDYVSIQKIMDRLVQVDLLLFDELAACRVSQWVSDYIYYLINRRYNEDKKIVFATNFYDRVYKGPGETLEMRIGDRLRSRLFEMADTIEIRGTDFRRKYLKG